MPTTRILLLASMLFADCFTKPPPVTPAMPLPPPRPDVIDPDATITPLYLSRAQQLRGLIGYAIYSTCTPTPAPIEVQPIVRQLVRHQLLLWGTDVYPEESDVCSAAIHAGRITAAQGGSVVAYIVAGQQSYRGSTRNGVTSQDGGPSLGSFSFDPANSAARSAPEGFVALSWAQSAHSARPARGDTLAAWCPSGGAPSAVWGTGSYTVDSSACTAALHAGAITLANGGAFTLRFTAGMPSYVGSEANGVETGRRGGYTGSFTIARAAATP